ncbi:sulfotransferase family protein [Actibacterium ureilyticum]|uniref:sulfotransferase family protein n=1 Tax=Actibacterium ureilyticum TaxID=1590614 RepID=UPI001FE7E58C|nr:sulfotransferase [Actibacterium ureilyticum]
MAMPDIKKRAQSALTQGMVRLSRGRAPHTGERPVFIIGSGRSGNTLVRRTLMASGQIYIPPETYVLGEIIENWTRSATLPWRERVWLFCAYFEKHPHFGTFGIENLNTFAGDAATWPKQDQTLRHVIDGFYRFMAQEHGYGARRWGEKSPWNTFHLPAISAFFSDAQFLWLVRDGRDAALSYHEARLYSTFADAARRWTRANEACLALSETRCDLRRVDYEALVSDPETVFARLFDWLGLDFDPGMLNAEAGHMGDVEALAHHKNVRKPISASSIGRWKSRLSPDDLTAAGPEFHAMLAKLGYDTD